MGGMGGEGGTLLKIAKDKTERKRKRKSARGATAARKKNTFCNNNDTNSNNETIIIVMPRNLRIAIQSPWGKMRREMCAVRSEVPEVDGHTEL